MPEALIQPQGDIQLNPDSPFAMAAHALVSGASDLNLVNGTFLDRLGSFDTLLTPAGKAHSFRKNGALIAQPPFNLGTQSFVEIWYGIPCADKGVSGASTQPNFLTGSTNNSTAIVSRLGDRYGAPAENWGSLYKFDTDWGNVPESLPTDRLVCIISVYTQNGLSLWKDGVKIAEATGVPAFNRETSAFMVGSFVEDPYWRSSGDTVLAGRAVMEATDEYLAYLGRNPNSVFAAPPVEDEPDVPAVATLAGNATAQAAASGALTTSIRLAGTATAGASATGSLSTAVRLIGSASAQASASGALATQIKLTGTAIASATASASLTTQVSLVGTATAGASASGNLSTGIALSGAAVASAIASGTLAGGAAQLSGAAVASASASGALTTSIQLAGAATAQATAFGTLGAAGAVLSGAAVATASASGALLTTIRMSGLAQASASASGALGGTAAQLSGAAVANATAAGALVTSIRLSGAAVARVTASGELGGSAFIRPTVPLSRTVNFESNGSNRVNFDRGTNRVNFDAGINRVDFDSATNKVNF